MCPNGTVNVAYWAIGGAMNTTVHEDCEMLISTLRTCCGQDSVVRFVRNAQNMRDLEENQQESEHLLVPAVLDAVKAAACQRGVNQFVAMSNSPGMVLLEHASSQSPLVDAVLSSLNLLILIVVLCLTSGIIIWSLETYWNPKDFPHSFSRGLQEGIWWAFVTMTTVGYGDRTPQSACGRIYAMAWTIFGIGIIAIFTSTVTSALTNNSIKRTQIFGSTVAVINWTEEHMYVSTMGGRVQPYPRFEDVMGALDQGEVDVALVDLVHIIPFSSNMITLEIKVATVISHPRVHGMLTRHFTSSSLQCLHHQFHLQRFASIDAMNQLNVLTKNQSYSTRDEVSRIVGVKTAVVITVSCLTGFGILLGCLLDQLIIPRVKKQTHCQAPDTLTRSKDAAASGLKNRTTPSLHQWTDASPMEHAM